MSGSKDEGILRLTLAAWKEPLGCSLSNLGHVGQGRKRMRFLMLRYAFHVDNDDDDISEHELEEHL